MSMRPGSTLIPSVSITVVPAGIVTSAPRADRDDAVAGDQDDAVADRRALVAVDDLAADQGQRGARGWAIAGRRGGREGKRQARACEASGRQE